MNSFLGHQTTVDFYGCHEERINSSNYIKKVLLQAAKMMNLSVVNAIIHEFSPIGVSGVIVIEESHIAIHTWPEHNYVAIDFFTCGKSYDLVEGIDWLAKEFQAKKVTQSQEKRGNLQEVKKHTLVTNGH
ncbi:adenosylmethionine decarboxylase [Pseudofulvibacter geojedonensis]|uniref:S-adenosylmethionine decarboxylase proenzyme n=1 Tax=Pseudofulvibacter geojedonensis TaxID=1123758 RepID=A0ABW3I3K6_9FLAO